MPRGNVSLASSSVGFWAWEMKDAMWDDWMISPQARCVQVETRAAARGTGLAVGYFGIGSYSAPQDGDGDGEWVGRLGFYFVSGYGEVVEMSERVGMRLM